VRYYGMYGAAIATMIAMFLFKLLIQPVYVCKAIEISLKKYYLHTVANNVFKTLVPLGGYFYFANYILHESYARIFFLAFIQLVLLVPAYYLILRKEERNKLALALGFDK